MSTPFSETATWISPVSGPDNGELADAGSVDGPFQGLVSRTAYLKALVESTGVKLVRSVATFAAMKALTGMAAAEVCIVLGAGMYQFLTGAPVADVGYLNYSATSGAGNWYRIDYLPWGTSGGLATLDTNARVVQLPLNQVVLVDAVDATGGASSATPSWVDCNSISFTAALHDNVFVSMKGILQAAGGGHATARIAVVDGAAVTHAPTIQPSEALSHDLPNGNTADVNLQYFVKNLPAGTTTVKIQVSSYDSGSASLYGGIHITVVRP